MSEQEKRQINVRLEQELYEFLIKYAKDNYKTTTAVLREMIFELYKESRKAPLIVKDKE